MKKKAYQVVISVTSVVVMVAFHSAILCTSPSYSFAGTSKGKLPAVTRTSAVEHSETQIKQLQDSLKITESQQPLWNNLTQVMRENAKDMDAVTKDRAERIKTMNSVEYMKFHSELTEAQLNHMKKLIPPFEALYTSMSDDQKKITDTVFRTGRHGKQKRK